MRKLFVLTVPVLLALACPAGASALIQVDRGIAGARLGNTQAQVRAALGKPKRKIEADNTFGSVTTFLYAGGLSVVFQGDTKVTSVTTKGVGDRTARGVGVGSTEADVKAKVAGVKCETIAGARSCHTGEFLAGKRVTDFQIRKGKVKRVTVGFVID